MNSSVQLQVIKISNRSFKSTADNLAVEEPLEIRLAFGSGVQAKIKNLAVTMRTPGNDDELAVGFLFTEGIIANYGSVKKVEHIFIACSENKENILQVNLEEETIPHLLQADRNFYTTSSCGVCGKPECPRTWKLSKRCG